MDDLLTVGLWVNTAGLTFTDLPTQRKCQAEELQEWLDAENMVQHIDAYCDTRFVADVRAELGEQLLQLDKVEDLCVTMASRLGLSFNQLEACYDEVIHSNFSKFCKSEADAQASCLRYEHDDVIAGYRKVGDYYVIYSLTHQEKVTPTGVKIIPKGKILKGIDYFDPNFPTVLDRLKEVADVIPG